MLLKYGRASVAPPWIGLAWVVATVFCVLCGVIGCEPSDRRVADAPATAVNEGLKSQSIPEKVELVNSAPEIESQSLLVKIEISGFSDNEGRCRVALYLGANHFNDPEFAYVKEAIPIADVKASIELKLQLPAQPKDENSNRPFLAVSAYHDKNDNTQLDKSSFGIPLERYGFSKNPRRGFGPPRFTEAAIELNENLDQALNIPILLK